MSDEFDNFAKSYELIHNQNLALVGAESGEFVRAKLSWCGNFATRHFSSVTSVKSFLDYGCGTGRFGHNFYNYFDRSWDYLGVDPSAASLEEAQRELKSGNKDTTALPDKSPLFLRLDSWHGSSQQYDFILAACVFHHIPIGQRVSLLCQLWDGLRPGGVIVVWEHNPWNPVTRKIVRECVFDRDALLLSIVDMESLWRKTKINTNTSYRFVTFFPGAWWRLQSLECMLGWLPLGGQWVCWARKTFSSGGTAEFAGRPFADRQFDRWDSSQSTLSGVPNAR